MNLELTAEEKLAWQQNKHAPETENEEVLNVALQKTLARALRAEEINKRYRMGVPTASKKMDWTDADWLEAAEEELRR